MDFVFYCDTNEKTKVITKTSNIAPCPLTPIPPPPKKIIDRSMQIIRPDQRNWEKQYVL